MSDLRPRALKAVLVLEDGSIFLGDGFGHPCEVSGEVVFNTGMVGYTEALTDPSYYGQILIQTYPLIGNYGVPSYKNRDIDVFPLHFESDRIQVTGYVVSSLIREPSHWSSERSLEDWMIEQRIPGIFSIDTRELTKKLRMRGTMLGILKVCNEFDIETLKSKAEKIRDPNERNLVSEVSVEKILEYSNEELESSPTVVVIDCGVKYGILRNIINRGGRIIQVPHDCSMEKILEYNPSGIIISNGPGDAKKCVKTIEMIKQLIETDIPIFGICLGLQLLSLATGAETYKMKFGHRGHNHPCLDLTSNRCFITSQNHGFSVEGKSLTESGFECSIINLNDKTVEGIVHKNKKIFATQFHPEASPGPYETNFLFDRFFDNMRR